MNYQWFGQLFKAFLALPQSGQSRGAVADAVEPQMVVLSPACAVSDLPMTSLYTEFR